MKEMNNSLVVKKKEIRFIIRKFFFSCFPAERFKFELDFIVVLFMVMMILSELPHQLVYTECFLMMLLTLKTAVSDSLNSFVSAKSAFSFGESLVLLFSVSVFILMFLHEDGGKEVVIATNMLPRELR